MLNVNVASSVKKVNTGFFQEDVNKEKAGAYYTDLGQVAKIASLLEFPTDETVNVLEPSVGNGAAVLCVTGKTKGDNVDIYGVDINTEAVKSCRNSGLFKAVLCGDYLSAKISSGSFSFCFSNPPYLDDEGERTEVKFLTEITGNLSQGGVLVWVVPIQLMSNEEHARRVLDYYDIEAAYRFEEYEFKKWKQLVFILRRKSFKRARGEDVKKFIETYSVKENLDELPSEPETKIRVYPSPAGKLKMFRTQDVDYVTTVDVVSALEGNTYTLLDTAFKSIGNDRGMKVYHPPVPTNNDTNSLLVVTGVAGGRVGDKDKGNFHFARGCVKRYEEETEEYDPQKKKTVVTFKSYVKTYMALILRRFGKWEVLRLE